MKILLLSLFLSWTTISSGQSFLKMDTLDQLPSELKEMAAGKFMRALKVDFNGDGKQDFICEMMPDQPSKATSIEFWITSELRTYKTKAKYGQDFDYFWFINLDEDKEPEIFTANGYEDGIDYAIYDQDLQTQTETLVAYINPIIIEDSKLFWGYPWDISGMITKKDKQTIFIKASLDHDIQRDGEITIPDPTKKFPAVFFYGHSTQPDIEVGQIREINWMSLKEFR
jgi:hypothetical protein